MFGNGDRIELQSSEYSLLELYCLRRFAFLSALGFSGLALKVEGGRFCRDEMQVLLSSSSSDSASESDESCLSTCSSVTALSLSFWVLKRRKSSTSDSDEAYSCASGWSVDGIACCAFLVLLLVWDYEIFATLERRVISTGVDRMPGFDVWQWSVICHSHSSRLRLGVSPCWWGRLDQMEGLRFYPEG